MNYNIGVIGLNHRTSPLERRESISFSPSKKEEALKKLKVLYPSNEYVILSTCNRVEIYIGSAKEKIFFDEIMNFLCSYHGISKRGLIPFIYTYKGKEAIAHLFEVASGIDSLVIGETQILGQMKKAYQESLELGSTGKILNTAFQKAFQVGKKVRRETKIAEGNVSVSSVSCQLACEVLGCLSQRRVLLIGAGKIGTLTLKSLRDRGADTVLVSSRNYGKAKVLAEEFSGTAVKFEKLEDFMAEADVVISATSAPHYIMGRDLLERVMKKRDNKPILLIDLAVPRDIDPLIGHIRGIYLYNIDSLKSIANQNMRKREKEIFQCRKIIKEENDKLFNTIMPKGKSIFPSSLYKAKSPCYSMEPNIGM